MMITLFASCVVFTILTLLQSIFPSVHSENKLQRDSYTWWELTIRTLFVFTLNESFWLFTLQYFITAVEVTRLFVNEKEAAERRFEIYNYVFICVSVVLLLSSIFYHLSFNQYKYTWELAVWTLSVPSIVFLSLMLYGLFKIKSTMKHHGILSNEYKIYLHVFFFTLFAI